MWKKKVQQSFEFSRLKFPQKLFSCNLCSLRYKIISNLRVFLEVKKMFWWFFLRGFFFLFLLKGNNFTIFFKNHKMSLFWHTGKAMKILFMVFRDVASADDRKDFNMKSGLSVLHTLERNHKIFIKIHVMYSVSACLCSWHECWRLLKSWMKRIKHKENQVIFHAILRKLATPQLKKKNEKCMFLQ